MKKLTLIQSNILYGCIELKGQTPNRQILDWMWIHIQKNITKGYDQFTQRVRESSNDTVENLLNSFDPDIVVLNEVMPLSDNIDAELKNRGYQIEIGEDGNRIKQLKNAVIIASKFRQIPIPFYLPGRSGGGAAVYIPKHDLFIFSGHPSAFNPVVRAIQIRSLVRQIRTYTSASPNSKFIFSGDLNTQKPQGFTDLDFNHITAATFPSKHYMKILDSSLFGYFKRVFLPTGVRELDHIFTSHELKTDYRVVETRSDHAAILVDLYPAKG